MEEFIIHINKREKTETLTRIEEAIHELQSFKEEVPNQKIYDVLNAIRMAFICKDQIILPIEIPEEVHETIRHAGLHPDVTFPLKNDTPLPIRTLELETGQQVFAVFTNYEEVMVDEGSSTITDDLGSILQKALLSPNMDGILFNPWNESFFLPKNDIREIFHSCIPMTKENIFSIQTMDITQSDTVCIVNAANTTLLGGGGVDGAIHRAAGPELLEECRTLHGCKTGEAKLTKGYNLKADYVIHTVGPIYHGTEEDARLLRNCYWNSLELAKANDIHSITFPAISTGVYGYPPEEAAQIALHTVSDWMKIHPTYGIAVLFACYDDNTTDLYNATWNKFEELWNDRPITYHNDGALEEAIHFAVKAHNGAKRKGSYKPYIIHPLEAMHILSSMNADINLMMAGVLHDTLEDTDTTLLDIYDKFGVDVAALVNSGSEDKRNVWYMRKLITTTELPNASTREKMLAIADKVSNLRSMMIDYKMIGDQLWERFNAPKEFQAWYYSNLTDALVELQNYQETADIYWEMTTLFKDLFVTYLVDDSKGLLYQIGANGESYQLKKGKPQWLPYSGKPSKKAYAISRKEAERIEDNWAEPFWAVHELDLSDAAYELYNDNNHNLFINIKDGELLFKEELSDETAPAGDDAASQSVHYHLDPEATHRLLTQLRLKHSTRNKLSTIFKNEFAFDDGSERFINYCNEIGVPVS